MKVEDQKGEMPLESPEEQKFQIWPLIRGTIIIGGPHIAGDTSKYQSMGVFNYAVC